MKTFLRLSHFALDLLTLSGETDVKLAKTGTRI
jgi:hypothetical protein